MAIRKRAWDGDVAAQVQWGDILMSKAYGPPDLARAKQWYDIAALRGYGPALNMVGRCFQFGWGCDKDLQEAARYYEAAGQAGDMWGVYNLGILTMRGIGMQADLKAALSLFRRAADNGHAKSMNLVGRFTEEGWHTQRNREMAIEWYRRSAEGGDYRGQHNYATVLLDQEKREDALRWWRKAVEEATSDILLAMRGHLLRLGEQGDAALLARTQERLEAMNIPRAVLEDNAREALSPCDAVAQPCHGLFKDVRFLAEGETDEVAGRRTAGGVIER